MLCAPVRFFNNASSRGINFAVPSLRPREHTQVPRQACGKSKRTVACATPSTASTVVPLQMKGLAEFKVAKDPHIASVLRMPPGTDLHDHALVTGGEIILQVRPLLPRLHTTAPAAYRRGLVLDPCRTRRAASQQKHSCTDGRAQVMSSMPAQRLVTRQGW